MPFSLQNQLINITYNNKPTNKEIEEHTISAIHRFRSNIKRKTEVKSHDKKLDSSAHFVQ